MSNDHQFCMLGLFEHKNNRVRLEVGCGWNRKSPVPDMIGPFDNRGRGVAGPHGVMYQVGWLQTYGRPLMNPFIARYGSSYGGLHRTETYNPFAMNLAYTPRHLAVDA